jgi:hypothetical protein
MPELNTEQLKTYIANKQWTEARKLLEDFFHFSLTEESERSDMLKNTSAYLEAINSLNRQHVEVLNNALAMLKELDTQQAAEESEIDLEATRNQIKDS